MANLLPLRLDLIEDEIRLYTRAAESIKERLEYADGGAYYQDKDLMNSHLQKAHHWRQILQYIKDKAEEEGQRQ